MMRILVGILSEFVAVYTKVCVNSLHGVTTVSHLVMLKIKKSSSGHLFCDYKR